MKQFHTGKQKRTGDLPKLKESMNIVNRDLLSEDMVVLYT